MMARSEREKEGGKSSQRALVPSVEDVVVSIIVPIFSTG